MSRGLISSIWRRDSKAGRQPGGIRGTVVGRATFDRIGDIDILAPQVDRCQHGIEQAPRLPNEGLPRSSFGARPSITDEQPVGLPVADAGNASFAACTARSLHSYGCVPRVRPSRDGRDLR